MINEYIQRIEATDYWDAKVYDLQASYFGDEVTLYFENDDDSTWRILFKRCASVEYETDAAWKSRNSEKLKAVKNMKATQLGYYCQDISIDENPNFSGFYDISLDLSVMKVKITCNEIVVDSIPSTSLQFFWEEN